jgi:AcrR family transcriptional regulator
MHGGFGFCVRAFPVVLARRVSRSLALHEAIQHGGHRRRETPRKSDLREQAILDTAEVCLERESPDTMTVEAIATGAGISRGSLYFYFYFGSKQDVLTALVARTVAVLTVDARAASGDVGSSPQDIVRNARTEKMWREHGRVMRAAVDLSSAVPRSAPCGTPQWLPTSMP